MPTAIRFNNSHKDGQNGVTVSEPPVEVQNQWEASAGRHGLLHLTRVRDGLPITIVCAHVSCWFERPDG